MRARIKFCFYLAAFISGSLVLVFGGPATLP